MYVGFAKNDITPPAGIELCGFGYYLQRKAEDAEEKLWCRAAYLKQGADATVYVVCDLIGLTVEHTDRLRRKLAERLHIPVAGICIACTHTHYGPATMALEGLGEMDADYMASLEKAILQCALEAARDAQPARLRYGAHETPGIAYNRRNDSFEPLDTRLQALLCERENDTVCLALFPCHPVSYGVAMNKPSADWPGAFAARLEARNVKPLVFQGCCGDVDPIARKENDAAPRQAIQGYADLLDDALKKIQAEAALVETPAMTVRELRFDLPLERSDETGIQEDKAQWLAYYHDKTGGFDSIPNANRFLERWAQRAKEMLPTLQNRPYVDNVPMQCLAIGPLKILGMPGEVFTEIGLRLQCGQKDLMILGFCGGNVGYLPTQEAYETPHDYACYAAPKFYHCIPFQPTIESVLVAAATRLLADIDNEV